jgi:hypothetical protein
MSLPTDPAKRAKVLERELTNLLLLVLASCIDESLRADVEAIGQRLNLLRVQRTSPP